MDVHMGIEGTNSNGHEEVKEEIMIMVVTIKKLQKNVQCYKVDNEKIMKSKEKHEEFNMNLIQSLVKIEKKMDKENDSRKLGIHKSP
jgi:hypothetical protein